MHLLRIVTGCLRRILVVSERWWRWLLKTWWHLWNSSYITWLLVVTLHRGLVYGLLLTERWHVLRFKTMMIQLFKESKQHLQDFARFLIQVLNCELIVKISHNRCLTQSRTPLLQHKELSFITVSPIYRIDKYFSRLAYQFGFERILIPYSELDLIAHRVHRNLECLHF